EGAAVVVYLAPERSDLPPLMAREPQRAFVERLRRFLDDNAAFLIDARDAVPAEYWGWEQDVPDRSHFTEPGHRLLARRLVEVGAAADRRRRGAVVIAANLGLLGVFKYADWVMGGASGLVSWLGGPALPIPHWILPLGISFYLFECLSYTIDVVRKRETPHPF